MFNHKTLLVVGALVTAIAGSVYAVLPKPLTMNVKYTVQEGDTMWGIATKYNGGDANTGEVIYEIEKYNHLTSPNLQPGEELHVPSPSAR